MDLLNEPYVSAENDNTKFDSVEVQAKHIHVTLYSHLSSVQLVTQRSSKLLSNSSANRAVDRLLDLAGGAGNAHVVLQNVAVHLETELKV
jgi:hypothetical protein